MKTRHGLLLRGIRWRLGASAMTVLTATMAVGAAVLAPLYLRAAGDSVVRSTVGAASVPDRGATLGAPTAAAPAAQLAGVQAAERAVEDAGGTHRWFGNPITAITSGVELSGPASSPVLSQLFSRTGICAVVHVESGACDLGPHQVLMSDRSAAELHVRPGQVINAGVQGSRAPLQLRVSGIYAVPNLTLSYWWGDGHGDFPFGQSGGPGGRTPMIDPLIASRSTALGVPARAAPQVTADIPLLAGRVNLSDERSLARSLSAATTAVAADGVTLSTQLGSVLASADHQRQVMSTIVVIAAAQLVLLAVWVLATLLVRSSETRQAEVRVARLRGFPPGTLLATTAAEPAVLCLIGTVVGVGLAWATVVVARNQLLDPSTPVRPDGWVLASLGFALAAIAGAVGIGTARVLRASSLGEAPGGARAAWKSRWGLIGDSILVVLSAVALIDLATSGALGGRSDPIASGAPGLIGLGVAVVAVQLALLGCRLAVSSSAGSHRVASFLAVRQIARRPVVLRQARVLIIALCLACFASAAWSVARSNRAALASFTVGTTAVVDVTPAPGTDLTSAVDKVDPGGRFAMAAVADLTPSSSVLAVDAARLPVAASWPAGISSATAAQVSRAIDPPTAPQVDLPASGTVRVDATASGPQTGGGPGALHLALWVFSPPAGTNVVDLGALHPGPGSYQAALGGMCPGGCRLAGVGVVPAAGGPVPAEGMVNLSVTAVSVAGPGAAGGGSFRAAAADLFPRGWQPVGSGVGVDALTGSRGMTFRFPAASLAIYAGGATAAAPPLASPADHPLVLPGVVPSEVQSLNGAASSGGEVPAQGLDGNTINVEATVTASALPRLGSDAVMVDLALLQRSQVATGGPYRTDQVWLGPRAPGDALTLLRNAGLRIDSVQRASTAYTQLERSGPALADDFLLLATVAALLLAASSTLGALGSAIRQRATELTALEVAGVGRGVLARSLLVESAVLAATALFGTAAGVIAAVVALPSLPELASAPAMPLRYGLPGGVVAVVSCAVVAAVLLTAAAVGFALLRRMSPSLLRTAPNDSAG